MVQLNRLIERLCDAGIDFVAVKELRAIAEKQRQE
jgi:hypothetical protein